MPPAAVLCSLPLRRLCTMNSSWVTKLLSRGVLSVSITIGCGSPPSLSAQGEATKDEHAVASFLGGTLFVVPGGPLPISRMCSRHDLILGNQPLGIMLTAAGF